MILEQTYSALGQHPVYWPAPWWTWSTLEEALTPAVNILFTVGGFRAGPLTLDGLRAGPLALDGKRAGGITVDAQP